MTTSLSKFYFRVGLLGKRVAVRWSKMTWQRPGSVHTRGKLMVFAGLSHAPKSATWIRYVESMCNEELLVTITNCGHLFLHTKNLITINGRKSVI
jgi:hypothetical protein